MATHLPDHWVQKVMVDLSIPGWLTGVFPHQVLRFFTAWAEAEGGGDQWDPINTTDHLSDSFGKWQGVDWNSIGVGNYTTPFHGIVATSATLLENTAFAGIVSDLRLAEQLALTAEEIVNRNSAAIKTWGTNPTTMLSVLKTIS
jgi:hypothetical protein